MVTTSYQCKCWICHKPILDDDDFAIEDWINPYLIEVLLISHGTCSDNVYHGRSEDV